MGKRSNKEQKTQRIEDQRAIKKQEQKHTLKVAIATVSVILAVALLITGGVFAGTAIHDAYLDSGHSYRKIVPFKTEHFKVNNAMLSFYFYDYLYDNVLDRLGLDHPDELKDRTFNLSDEDGKNEETVTYFTYYNEIAAKDLQNELLYAEAAVSQGVTLDQRDRTFIANRLESFKISASSLGLDVKEYLASRYGRGVTLKDIENTLTITTYAAKQNALCYGGQTVTDEEVRAYLDKTNLNYTKIDYYLHDILIPAGASADEKQALREQAEKLVNCKTDEEFLTELRAQLTKEYGEEEGFDDKLLEELVRDTVYTESVLQVTESTGKLDAFIHDPARKQGDSYLSVGTKSYGIVRIARARYSVDQPLDTLRIIRFDYENFPSKADALSAFNTLKKSLAGKSMAEFSAAAKDESHDRVTAMQEGYYVLKPSDTTSLATLLEGKLTDAREGDLIEVSSNKSIWLVYYCGKGKTLSEADAASALRSQKAGAIVDRFFNEYEMIYDTTKIYKIAPLKESED